MTLVPLSWDTNLRTNLRLWPQVAPNVSALASASGETYDEARLMERFPDRDGKSPTDTRAVRNTFEVLAYAGLMYRDDDRLVSSELGHQVFEFLGIPDGSEFANDRSVEIASQYLISGLAVASSIRAIWELLLLADRFLTNEELNRAMGSASSLEDIEGSAAAVLEARGKSDPTLIGDRIYRPEEFGTGQESDQRKAMNPHFLLAGGGGLFISVEGNEERRSLQPWAVDAIERSLRRDVPVGPASTEARYVRSVSAASGVPRDVREGL